MERLKAAKDNKEARMNFVSYWANFVRTRSDQEWGGQHTELIDAMMQSAKYSLLTPRQYLEIKGERIGKSR